jgi:hypothetical protein
MLIKALRGNFGDDGHIRKGQVIETNEFRAQQLVASGIFIPVQGAAPDGSGPLSRSGGQNGQAKPPSFSPQVHPQKKPISKPSKPNAG